MRCDPEYITAKKAEMLAQSWKSFALDFAYSYRNASIGSKFAAFHAG
jgi:hypothetical protein